jgi:pSer/pThr/pTyr-binding forkhead associated (FHA) protein
MQHSTNSEGAGSVSLDLLDTSSGLSVNSWSFRDKGQIAIGRAPDQDVTISHPYVSRNHANLEYRDGSWRLKATGRNGVIVGNEYIDDLLLGNEMQFRLGLEGPTLKFSNGDTNSESGATMSSDPEKYPQFELNHDDLGREVAEIEQGDYFRNLQRMAKELRSQRNNAKR